MKTSPLRPLLLAGSTVALLVGCSTQPATILLSIQADLSLSGAPDRLEVSVFTEAGRVVDRRRLPSAGAPTLPSDLVLYPSPANAKVRVLVNALASDQLLGNAAVSVQAVAEKEVKATVLLRAPPLGDRDGDGVPDAIDNCPEQKNAEQRKDCGGVDAGVDGDTGGDGPAVDGSTDAQPADTVTPIRPVVSSSGWGFRHPLPQANTLNGVWGASAAEVWAVGQKGIILVDRGNGWSAVSSPTGVTLNAIWGSGAQDIWAVGEKGVTIRYDGKAWQTVATPTTDPLRGVWGSAANNVWAVGGSAIILRFDGTLWKEVANGGDNRPLYGVWGSSASDVYAVGERNAVHYDGALWSKFDKLKNNRHYAIAGNSSTAIWVASEKGRITTFDGSSWSDLQVANSKEIWRSIWASQSGELWAVGDGGSVHFNGTDWREMTTPRMRGVWGEGKTVWAVGEGGAILKSSGMPWVDQRSAVTGEQINGHWRSPTGKQWFVGNAGTILRFDGKWTKVSSPTPNTLSAIWGRTDNEIYAVGSKGVLIRYDGTSWKIAPSGSAHDLFAIHGLGSGDLWTAGGNCNTCGTPPVSCCTGRVYNRVAGNWTSFSVGSKILRGIWAFGAADVWVVGDSGTLRRFESGKWRSLSWGRSDSLRAIWASSPTDIHLAGSGVLAHYNGTWSTKIVPQTLYAISGIANVAVWAVGTSGAIYRRNGTIWAQQESGADVTLRSVLGVTATDAWAAGDAAAILHYDDTVPGD